MIHDFTKPGHASVLIDGQFGSTGKGLIAAALALTNDCDIAVTNASANAGHTTVMGDRKFVCFHTPTFAAVNRHALVYLDAGAIIDPEVLLREVDEFGLGNRLFIHPHAAIITQDCRDSEKKVDSSATKIASTQKGVGTAQVAKIMRRGPVAKDVPMLAQWVKPLDLVSRLDSGARVVIEVPQGFGLSVNSGFWPFTTCREVSVSQAMADAQLHPSYLGKVMMTCRTFPIRVGNILDPEGKELGFSGPGYPDQEEITWADVGREPELTTVTKRVRRIFKWSQKQYEHSLKVLRPDYVALTFCDYFNDDYQFKAHLREMGKLKLPSLLSIGPDVADIYTLAQTDEIASRRGWTRGR